MRPRLDEISRKKMAVKFKRIKEEENSNKNLSESSSNTNNNQYLKRVAFQHYINNQLGQNLNSFFLYF